MRQSIRETRLVFPALEPLYERIGEFAYPFIRAVIGLTLVPHGWGKFVEPQTQASLTGLLHKLGFEPAVGFFWFLACLELFGGPMLAMGLLTRVVAPMIAIEMAVIAFGVFLPQGRPIEYVLMWGLISFAIAWRGGGRYSLDHLIGREL